MTGSRIAVVLIGDVSAREMQPVVALLQSRDDQIVLRHLPTVADFQRLTCEEAALPDFIVALQTWPGEFSGEEVRMLLSLAPLARIVCVCGRWCDSEGRTGKHWPLAVRAPVPCAAARLARELAALRGRSTFVPLTATRGEIFAADCVSQPRKAACAREIAVISPDRHWKGMLAAALRRVGHRLIGDAGTEDTAFVWDADPWDDVRTDELRALRRRYPRSTIVACAGFIGDDIVSELECAGADAVWFKLAPLAVLMPMLDAGTPATI